MNYDNALLNCAGKFTLLYIITSKLQMSTIVHFSWTSIARKRNSLSLLLNKHSQHNSYSNLEKRRSLHIHDYLKHVDIHNFTYIDRIICTHYMIKTRISDTYSHPNAHFKTVMNYMWWLLIISVSIVLSIEFNIEPSNHLLCTLTPNISHFLKLKKKRFVTWSATFKFSKTVTKIVIKVIV